MQIADVGGIEEADRRKRAIEDGDGKEMRWGGKGSGDNVSYAKMKARICASVAMRFSQQYACVVSNQSEVPTWSAGVSADG